MASDDIDLAIICFRADQVPADARVAGASLGSCASCGAAISLSPTTQQQLARGRCAAYCDTCCQPEQFPLTTLPGQLQELRRHYGFPD